MKIYLFIIILVQVFSANALVTEWESSLPVNSNFKVSSEMRSRVDFWKKIYAETSEQEGLFHDPENPNIIYGEISFKSIHANKNLSSYQRQQKINKLISDRREQIAKKYNIKNMQKIRLQMGLKERMQRALFLSGRYLPMMEQVFKDKKLPIELTRLVFVESSFNVNAQSKVGASGLWQIMPFVARPEGYIKNFYDKRNHPYYSTVLAAEILADNYRILKKWPLAVTAYNHGATGVRRMVNLGKSKDIVDLIDSEKSTRSWGFASRNFYACFLAVLEVEKEAKSLFGTNLIKSKPLAMNRVVTKKAIPKKVALKYFSGSVAKFKKYNPHLNIAAINKHNKIPAGIPLVLPVRSTSAYFQVRN